MEVHSKYSNVIVKSETKDYGVNFEIQNDNSIDNGECNENNFKIKKEIVKNEEQESEISKFELQASCYSPCHNFKTEVDLIDDNLEIKTESQHNDLCSNVVRSVEEFTENCDVDEKVDISEVTLLSTEYNDYQNLTFDIKDEKPRIFESKQSRSDHLQQEEKINNDSYQATNETVLNMHITSVHNNNNKKIKINCDYYKSKSFSAKMTLDDDILQNHSDRTKSIKSKIHNCTICSYQTTSIYNLKMHIDSIHYEQKIKIRCEFCDKSFSTNRVRDNHILKNHKDVTSLIKSKIYSCSICLYQTTSHFHLRRHINAIHDRQKINCDFCDKSFSRKTTRDEHVLRNHKEKINFIKSNIYSCTICPYQTTSNCLLNSHINLIHDEQKINCDFCNKSFSTKKTLDGHLLKNHKDKTSLIKSKIRTCTICPYQTLCKSNLNRHIRLIHNKQKINCEFCNESFSKKIILDDHVLKNHKDNISLRKSKIYSCTICLYKTRSNFYLNRHMNLIHNKQKIHCNFCGQSFSAKRVRDDHLLKKHKDKTSLIKSTILIHNKQKICCDFCDMSFTTKILRDGHVLKHHKDKISLVKSKVHTCTICSYQTVFKSKLTMHINLIHNKQKINCDFCDKSFTTKYIRDDHVLKKHKDKTGLIKSNIYTCTICLYQTSFKAKLNSHIYLIHDKQKINCDFCDKSFTTKKIRDGHVLKKHKDKTSLTNSEIHTCTICSYQTLFKSKLNRHFGLRHNKEKENCDFCDKSFTTKKIRDDHVLKIHKDKSSLIKSKIHTCTICSYQTSFKSKLNTHIRLVHNIQKINCDFCDSSFSRKIICDNHVLKNHKDKTSSITSKIHTCTICPYQTTVIYHLKKHINLVHDKQKVNCDFCDKSFSETIILDDHVLNHHKEKTGLIKSKIHTCTICSFQTTFKAKLNRHINSIHMETKKL